MTTIVLDFEFSTFSKPLAQRTGMRAEIVQIGAVRFKNGRQNDTFNRYIHAEYSINRNCRKLCGITSSLLEGEKEFPQVLDDFLTWCFQDPDEEIEIVTWGSEDYRVLYEEAKAKQLLGKRVLCLLNNWVDYQDCFQTLIHWNDGNKLKLAAAARSLDIEFVGKAHDGLCDALTLGEILALCRDEQRSREKLEPIRSLFRHEEQAHTCLGDLIPRELIASA